MSSARPVTEIRGTCMMQGDRLQRCRVRLEAPLGTSPYASTLSAATGIPIRAVALGRLGGGNASHPIVGRNRRHRMTSTNEDELLDEDSEEFIRSH